MQRFHSAIRASRAGALVLALAASAVVLSGCRDTSQTQSTGCSSDLECVPENSNLSAEDFRCELETGVCYCRTNNACPAKQFCNTAGFCQDKSGCEKNEDCIDPSLFCDTNTGTCLSEGRCTVDLHCPLGQVCDTAASRCVDGCRTNGDCPNVSCRCGELPCNCQGTTQEEMQACEIGVCDSNFCSNNTYCRPGELCGAQPDAGMTRNACYSDYDPNRRPYCDNCVFGGSIPPCGSGPNYCLVNTTHGGSYCGADCSSGQACPNGYRCADVIVVGLPGTASCTRANPFCPSNPNLPCTEDSACPRGGVCQKQQGATSGFCAGKCSIDEGDNQGFCSCLVDNDCAQETCSAGECSVSRRPCVTEQDCRSIRCVDFAGAGGCLIGQNCAPADGLSCLDVKPQP